MRQGDYFQRQHVDFSFDQIPADDAVHGEPERTTSRIMIVLLVSS
jgi:hypothetical protein